MIHRHLPFMILAASLAGLPQTCHGAAEGNTAPQTILPTTASKAKYPKIVIYTVVWCPHCRELKEYLSSRNIPFTNRDVEVDAAAMEELTKKYKSKGVPIVVIGNDQEILKGFTADSFEKAAARVLASEKK